MAQDLQELQASIRKVICPVPEPEEPERWWNQLAVRATPEAPSDNGGSGGYLQLKQMALGGASGWCAGFLIQKYGRAVATAVGGGLLLLQVARRSGYVTVDWSKLETDVNKVTPELNSLAAASRQFVQENAVLASGFVGGFLLGLAA